ncbi:MAG TPA: hypothetical protein VFT98_18540 [Myxococcota bacterium]|nr:hypothetical protein [Myxococcota bacterium]
MKKHFDALVADAEAAKVPGDVIGRLALEEVVALWLRTREWRDVASELEFHAHSLDPDADFEFMRP